ncbi:hypothetical protein LIA77_01142 [Sarocladium implicatum]|nr:hypothetical protein LIA77_01142 [Sarocladium implicatum]
MARTKDDVKAAAAAASPDTSATPKRRGRPAKDVTAADTGAKVKKTPGKRGRPAGSGTKPKPASTNPDGTPKKRGRPPGSGNGPKPKATADGAKKGPKKSSSAAAKRLRDFLPAIPAQESTTGADRRRAKLASNKLEMLPPVKKSVKPDDKRRKNKGVAPKKTSAGKAASSPAKADLPAPASLENVDGE